VVRRGGEEKREEGRYDDDRANDATPQHPNDSVGWERQPQRPYTEKLETPRQEEEGGEAKEDGQDEGQDEREDDG